MHTGSSGPARCRAPHPSARRTPPPFPRLARCATLAPMKLPVTEFEAAYRPTGDFRLPEHSGSLLRGVLGRALRQTGCSTPRDPCPAACLRRGRCTYSRLFDPPLPEPLPHRLLRGATEAPPPLLPLIPRPGRTDTSRIVLGVRVLGTLATDDTDRLLAALQHTPPSDSALPGPTSRSSTSGGSPIPIAPSISSPAHQETVSFTSPSRPRHGSRTRADSTPRTISTSGRCSAMSIAG